MSRLNSVWTEGERVTGTNEERCDDDDDVDDVGVCRERKF